MVMSPGWFQDVRDLASEHTFISPFMIHRRLRISRRAAVLILDELERLVIVGPAEGDGTRKVLSHG